MLRNDANREKTKEKKLNKQKIVIIDLNERKLNLSLTIIPCELKNRRRH